MRKPLLAAALALFVSAGVPLVAGAGEDPEVKVPKPGRWAGPTEERERIELHLTGKTIEIAAFGFDCGKAVGRTSLNSLVLTKTRRGYKFGIRSHGTVSYSDERPDQNGAIELRGRWGPRARVVKGFFKVKTRRCTTGEVTWTARRRD